jgi:hypothetical protein
MDINVAIIMFVLLMANTWWNYRAGYRKGAVGGHLVGVHEVTEFLMENGHLDATNVTGNRPATVEEMTGYFVRTLHERRVKLLENSEA